MKIAILGYSGSGKSTLGKELGLFFNIPVLHLDTVQFESDWKERNRKKAITMVSDFMSKEDWVIDGNYIPFLQKERLSDADFIIYLSFSRFNCLYRAFKRFLKYRNTTRDSIANGCKEKFDLEFIWWILQQSRNRKTKKYYNSVFRQHPQKCIIIKNQKQLDALTSNPNIFSRK